MEDLIQAAEKAYQARNSGDLDGFCEILDQNVVMELPGTQPICGTFRGIASVKVGLERSAAAWKSITYDLERITRGPDILIAYLHVLIESNKGVLYGGPVAELLRYSGDKVVELRPFNFDTHRIREIF